MCTDNIFTLLEYLYFIVDSLGNLMNRILWILLQSSKTVVTIGQCEIPK